MDQNRDNQNPSSIFKTVKWREEIKTGQEANLCREAFLLPQKESSQKQIYKRLRLRNVIYATVILYLSICFFSGCYAILDLKAQTNELVRARIEAKIAQVKMRDELKWMKTENAVEAIAREQLGMVRPGEILITQKDG